jgi:tetratricopeptide (TPR) repeat protein
MRYLYLAVGVVLTFTAKLDYAEPSSSVQPVLGTVSFETSCKPQVKTDFYRGVALLHSFWHDEAARTFERVAAVDPACAMAYWGEAMTHFHQFLDNPQPSDLAAAHKELLEADAAHEKSVREAAYLHALHLFFDGLPVGFTSKEYVEHAKPYSDAMGAIASEYPEDLEAKVFYALSLLTSDPPDDTALVNPRKAFAILEPLFRKYPNHPGIAHYIIHATDNPQMAQEGLEAARRYALIAPSVPHALHMPAHIFARLGLWPDLIRSNLASKAAAERIGLHIDAESRLHAMEFLEYAYLQTGRSEEALKIIAEGQRVKQSDVNPRYADYYPFVEARFPSIFAIETRDWTMAAGLKPLVGAQWFSEALTLLAHAEAAAHGHDPRAGEAAERAMDASLSREHLRWDAPRLALPQEVHAWAELAKGDLPGAQRLLQPIADRQETIGKNNEVEIPAREMLAEMLLMSGDPAEALKQYERSLASDPNRFNGLLGAALAAKKLGREDLVDRYFRMLLSHCEHADGSQAARLAAARAKLGLPLAEFTR